MDTSWCFVDFVLHVLGFRAIAHAVGSLVDLLFFVQLCSFMILNNINNPHKIQC